MTIIRSPKPENSFLIVGNDVLRDDRLSFRARGILVCVLSRPDNWSTSAEQLAREGREGVKAIYAALTELEQAGYLRREKFQDERGRWCTKSLIFDVPQFVPPKPVEEPVSTEPPFPTVGLPTVGEPMLGNLPTIKRTEKKNRKEIYIDDFELFWKTYPRKVGRAVALKAYEKALKSATPSEIQKGLESALLGWRGKEIQFVPHASTWLNQGRWADEESPSVVNAPSMFRKPSEAPQEPSETQKKALAIAEGKAWRGIDESLYLAHRDTYEEWLRHWLDKGYLDI